MLVQVDTLTDTQKNNICKPDFDSLFAKRQYVHCSITPPRGSLNILQSFRKYARSKDAGTMGAVGAAAPPPHNFETMGPGGGTASPTFTEEPTYFSL